MLDRLLQFVTGSPAFQFLRGVTPFEFLPDDELGRLGDVLAIEYLPKGSTLYVQGQSAVKDVHVVMSGSLEVVDEGGGASAEPRCLGVGQTYGGCCILDNGGIALYTVRATEDAFLYAIPASPFLDVCSRHPEFHDFFAERLGVRMLERVGASVRRKMLLGARGGAGGLDGTVGQICSRDVAWCAPGDSIREAARCLASRRLRALLVRDDGGALVGLVSERDLVAQALAAGVDPARPVSDVMVPAGEPAPSGMGIPEAVEVMVRTGARWLPVAGDGGNVVGLLGDEDLLADRGSPLEYLREIAQTKLRRDLAERRARLPDLVTKILFDGARVESLTWLVSAVSDTTLRRLLEMAVCEMGPPPAPFAFLALGSEGRREQTLVTDQDNAIVFADVLGQEKAAADYFARLGERVCTWLNEAGVEYCEANVMASNPRWCQPLSAWKEYFTSWVRVPEPEAVLHSSIFFDFRPIYGDAAVAAGLRDHVVDLLSGRPGMFFHLLAKAVVEKELPLGTFGRIAVETHGSRADVFDIKHPVARIIELARLHALWHGVRATSTLDRLRALSRQGELDAKTCLDLEHAYSFLMQLRLARQVAALGEGARPADNLVGTGEISTLDQRFLEDSFRLIARVQASAGRKFLRTM